MKILLISPNIKGLKGGINRIQPPLGLAYLASYLKLHQHDVFIRDTAIEGYKNYININDSMHYIGESAQNIEEFIDEIRPDVVGISVLFSNVMDSVHIIANIVKNINKNIIVCVGGNHITNILRDYEVGIDSLNNIKNNNIDYYFSGESEQTFLSFIENRNLSGVSYFKGNTLISNKRNSFFDINSILDPDWSLFNMEKYFEVGLFHSSHTYSNRVLPVMASRGCPEKCQFCSTPLMFGSKVRWKSPRLLFEEIQKNVLQYKIGEIQFQDDTLTANIKNLYELCEYLKELNIPWCTPNGIKINYHQKSQFEMFKTMKESGCYQTTFACESGSQQVLDTIIKKNIKVDTFSENIQKAKDAGLMVHTFWILGFPGETKDEMLQTLEVAKKSGADSFSVAIFNPLPGTPLYHKVHKENLWWNKNIGIDNMTFRNSLIKVDGFSSAEEFEKFIYSSNVELNSMLETQDPIRYDFVNENRGAHLFPHQRKIKQT